MQIYYSNQNGEHCVYIDAEQHTRIFLPPEVSPVDAEQFASSEASLYVLKQITQTKGDI